jgi:very-short-patch-repair endonuclease
MKHEFARKLRREQTNAERRLWSMLRNRHVGNHKFRRQEPIGPYIVDFVCFEARLIVELDGELHDRPEAITYDAMRTAFLKSRGFRVLRFWNRELDESADSVVHAILAAARDI